MDPVTLIKTTRTGNQIWHQSRRHIREDQKGKIEGWDFFNPSASPSRGLALVSATSNPSRPCFHRLA